MKISIDTFFKVLNFAVYIGLIVFLVKRYVLGNIASGMVQEKQNLLDLKKEHEKLQQACHKISQQIEQDELNFALLRSKFKLWHAEVAKQDLQIKQNCQERQQKIEMLMMQKMKYLKHRRVIEKEVPQLLQSAEQALQKKFQDDKSLGKKYQKKLLDTMRKSNSL